MAEIIQINETEANRAREFAKQVANGNITHAVITYRTIDGDLKYDLFGGDEYATYFCGMLSKLIHTINVQNEDFE